MMALTLATFVLCVRAVGDVSSDSLRWTEHMGQLTTSYRLVIERSGTVGVGTLRIKCESLAFGEVWTTNREDSLRNGIWAEWKLNLAIAVKGDARPQVLAKLYRPNWMDVVIYSLRYDGLHCDGIEKTFSFSSRDEQAIRWNVEGGKLASLETFDKYETVPDYLLRQEAPRRRWVLHSHFRYDTGPKRWRCFKRAWELLPADRVLSGTAIERRQDCRFLYR